MRQFEIRAIALTLVTDIKEHNSKIKKNFEFDIQNKVNKLKRDKLLKSYYTSIALAQSYLDEFNEKYDLNKDTISTQNITQIAFTLKFKAQENFEDANIIESNYKSVENAVIISSLENNNVQVLTAARNKLGLNTK